jgi:hypothetical protein
VVLESTQPLTEMNTKILPRGKARLGRYRILSKSFQQFYHAKRAFISKEHTRMLTQNKMATYRGRFSWLLVWSSDADRGAVGGSGDPALISLRGPLETALCGAPWRPHSWRLLSLVLADRTPAAWDLEGRKHFASQRLVTRSIVDWTRSGAHQTSYPMGAEGSFSEGKAAGE